MQRGQNETGQGKVQIEVSGQFGGGQVSSGAECRLLNSGKGAGQMLAPRSGKGFKLLMFRGV